MDLLPCSIHPKLERQRQGKDRARPGREVRVQRHKIHQKFIYLSISQTALTGDPSEFEIRMIEGKRGSSYV